MANTRYYAKRQAQEGKSEQVAKVDAIAAKVAPLSIRTDIRYSPDTGRTYYVKP